jgi:ADP-ribose pyrophosphatase YjhB (NUDIX family)
LVAQRPVPIRVEKSAGGVVVRVRDGVVSALLIRDPYRNWGLPKGHVEEGEEPHEAALREVSEETGLEDLELGPELVTIDWYFRAPEVQIHKFTTFYLMESKAGDPVPELGEGITECVWVPIEEAPNKITYDNAREVMKVAQRAVAERDENPETRSE